MTQLAVVDYRLVVVVNCPDWEVEDLMLKVQRLVGLRLQGFELLDKLMEPLSAQKAVVSLPMVLLELELKQVKALGILMEAPSARKAV
ncbi:hypothetical protein GGH99_002159 [Coemansia sp. RSA 1285]|nr:hypothetical protein GGH99_002159 [Coemansia sp. RSA 1285]